MNVSCFVPFHNISCSTIITECSIGDRRDGGMPTSCSTKRQVKGTTHPWSTKWTNISKISISQVRMEYRLIIHWDSIRTAFCGDDFQHPTEVTKVVKMPAPIEQCVRRQNIRFLHNRNQFTLEYFRFMKRILVCNIPYIQPVDDHLVSSLAISCVFFTSFVLRCAVPRVKPCLSGTCWS